MSDCDIGITVPFVVVWAKVTVLNKNSSIKNIFFIFVYFNLVEFYMLLIRIQFTPFDCTTTVPTADIVNVVGVAVTFTNV